MMDRVTELMLSFPIGVEGVTRKAPPMSLWRRDPDSKEFTNILTGDVRTALHSHGVVVHISENLLYEKILSGNTFKPMDDPDHSDIVHMCIWNSMVWVSVSGTGREISQLMKTRFSSLNYQHASIQRIVICHQTRLVK